MIINSEHVSQEIPQSPNRSTRPQPLTYEEVLFRIENARRFGNLPGVEVSRVMLEKLANPQQGMPYVHIAGTNGKGSTSAFLSSILTTAGRKVGTFTSPHLVDFRERITINGQMIPRETVTRLGNQLLSVDWGVSATMFDYCLIMAVLYFREQQCDLAVMETGLGGRLDSTNALGTPEVSIITKIGLDHTAILGNTLSEIAAEKAGIMKDGSYLVLEQQEPEAERILLEQAVKHQLLSNMVQVTQSDLDGIAHMKRRLRGTYQLENASAAIKAAEYLLRETDPAQRNGYITEGIAAARWPGRMEILSHDPFLLVDGAHNGHGVLALRDSLATMYPGEKFHFIMGVMADKDYENMITELLPMALDFVTVTPESSRALQGEALAGVIRKKGIPAVNCRTVEQIEGFLSETQRNIAFGSLYFIGEIIGERNKRTSQA